MTLPSSKLFSSTILHLTKGVGLRYLGTKLKYPSSPMQVTLIHLEIPIPNNSPTIHSCAAHLQARSKVHLHMHTHTHAST
eukprot:c39962_g1_i1 orf=170-409(+)